jgi:hypothetical protein
MGLIETSYFNTRGIAPAGRFAAWRENIGVVFDVTAHDEKSEERFSAHVESFLLDGIVINHCKLGAQRFSRSAGRIARDGIDHYQIHIFLRGSVEMECGARSTRAKAGDFVVLDHADTFSSRTTDYEILNVFIPRRRLAPDARHASQTSAMGAPARMPCRWGCRAAGADMRGLCGDRQGDI